VIGLFKAEDVEFATLEWGPPAEFEMAYHDRQAAPSRHGGAHATTRPGDPARFRSKQECIPVSLSRKSRASPEPRPLGYEPFPV
jgi:hypothetical protein